ncbi:MULTISPECIES: translational machinery protein [unclassified Mesorhizobium]|uniref:translational machinery protein n=1 Tax=unclassified Mesorhizobium TaxID=325217 RepID=UPI000FCB22DE|nr:MULTISPECIES: translational machinery protein [unclassified Mesorhizobium]RUZ71881.1 translational machinery protein [Mesorhizobium sp. M7A.F.Ca.US.003.02.2.1]MBZ9717890.1 translational machinery protein [Mesorhizobium sp. AD1-1]RUY86533.1 translational machinery protein [Mesorhizobium sp. M7A.F.Ca.CA.001.12.2.1]RUZ29431.1 translational machinery protein [Mesorhizobium sp. M7A.F.Ca.US.007.01.2.1]RUZ38574.1 translational machinery protein [Mesorhizobium sp. M7A.F.Ca.US.003.02.1.1]
MPSLGSTIAKPRCFSSTVRQPKRVRLVTTLAHHQTHNKAGSIDGKRAPEDDAFYHDVINALEPAKEWLIVGPGSAKDELAKHIRDHHAHLKDRIVGVETADHPTEAQIVAHARSFFRAADRMLP